MSVDLFGKSLLLYALLDSLDATLLWKNFVFSLSTVPVDLSKIAPPIYILEVLQSKYLKPCRLPEYDTVWK
jgi:hypothetical protein